MVPSTNYSKSGSSAQRPRRGRPQQAGHGDLVGFGEPEQRVADALDRGRRQRDPGHDRVGQLAAAFADQPNRLADQRVAGLEVVDEHPVAGTGGLGERLERLVDPTVA